MIFTMLKNNKILRQIIAVAFWVTAWFIIARLVDNSLLVASPIDTVRALIEMLSGGTLMVAVFRSLLRIMAGFLLGALVASVMAVLAYNHEVLETAFEPVISLCKAVPVAAFAVILIIWFGVFNLSMLIAMIVVMPIMYSNLLEGLKNTDRKLLEMAKCLDVLLYNKIFFIYRPSLAPFICSAVKTGIGTCWKAGVAAEVIGLCSKTIGGELYISKVYFDTAAVFAWAGVTVAVSFLMEKLVVFIVRKLLQMEVSCRGKEASVTGDGNVKIRNISKSFDSKVLYNGYSADWKKGETYKLDGISGSGKTTLLRMVAGLDKPDAGEILCSGKVVMMFQEDRLCEDYSAVCNVAMTGIGEDKARAALKRILDESSLDKPCRELSGGMKRRVALVRAMECPADTVLLDEPYTGLDDDTLKVVKEYINSSKQSKTVIVASHIL